MDELNGLLSAGQSNWDGRLRSMKSPRHADDGPSPSGRGSSCASLSAGRSPPRTPFSAGDEADEGGIASV